MKIVLNQCFGGFGLSKQAVALYKLKTGKELILEDNDTWFIHDDPERWDPFLVEVVEELGELSNGEYSNLVVVEIEDGKLFKIDEYEGVEWIVERDEIPWITSCEELTEQIHNDIVKSDLNNVEGFVRDSPRIGKIIFPK